MTIINTIKGCIQKR